MFPHLSCDKITCRFLNLPGEHQLIRASAGKVQENKSLATSLNTWQTKDYYFNGKFYLKDFKPKENMVEALALHFKYIFLLMNLQLASL